MELDIYDCPHCNTKGILPMADFCCPNCKKKIDSTVISQGNSKIRHVLKRPTSVTVISWILIIWAVIVLIVSFVIAVVMMNSDNNEHKSAPGILILGGLMLAAPYFMMGQGMLNAKNWARLLYLWFTAILIVLCILDGNKSTIIVVVSYITFAIYLTRPVAVAYFHREKIR